MSRRTKIIAAIVGLVVVGGIVAAVTLGGQGSGPEVETATVTTQELAVTVSASGKVEAGVSADVFPPAAGTLDTVEVSEGETVTAGTTLAQMDTAPLELAVAQAEAGLAQAKSQLANVGVTGGGSADVKAAKDGVTAAQKALTAAKAAESAARSAWNNADDFHEAMKDLYPSSSTTVTAAATAEKQAYAGYKQAQAGVSQAQAGVSSAKAGLVKARAACPASQKAAARAGVEQAAEALSVAEQALEDATLLAPIDGVVLFNATPSASGAGAKPAEGTAVSPAAAPFTVVDLEALKFTAEVDEADIDRVKTGMSANVTLDSFPGDEFVTMVARVNPAAQPTATGGTIFAVELALVDTGKDVLIGMKGDAEVEVSSRGAALTVPVEALFSEGGTDYVYVVTNSTLKKTEITVGATTDTEVEVLEGLAEGDVVALSGSTQYTDGMTVRVKE